MEPALMELVNLFIDLKETRDNLLYPSSDNRVHAYIEAYTTLGVQVEFGKTLDEIKQRFQDEITSLQIELGA